MKKKRITAALLALGLSAVTICSQLPVFAAEETAQTTDTAAQPQTADPSVVTTNGIDGWPQASDISSTAAIEWKPQPIQFSIPRTPTRLFILPAQSKL